MARRKAKVELTPGQAHYVLQRLVSDRRVKQSEITRYVADMRQEINELEQRLSRLREAAVAMGGAVSRAVGRVRRAVTGKKRRRRGPVSAERRASQQLQGRYLGLIRQVPAGKRAHYTKVAKERGREVAIKEMQSLLAR